MAKELTKQHHNLFEQIKQTDEKGNKIWMTRQLSKALEYTDFRNLSSLIDKSQDACRNSGQPLETHIVRSNEKVTIGSRAQILMSSYNPSRDACYLIVQN